MIIEIEETRQKIKNLDYYFLLNIKWFISFLYLMLLTPMSPRGLSPEVACLNPLTLTHDTNKLMITKQNKAD